MKRLWFLMNRNKKSLCGRTVPHKVNLEWWNKTDNLGDYLATVIYDWMTKQYGIEKEKRVPKAVHLLTVGSLISMGSFDAVVWGTGLHNVKAIDVLKRQHAYRKYDIRAVRGPLTRQALLDAGFQCPSVYGDPAILMPRIFMPDMEKKYEVSVILHMSQEGQPRIEGVHYINIRTTDYKTFIQEVAASKKIVSGSLHGIILAESYGVPAVFYQNGMHVEMMKYRDWYASTGNRQMQAADSIEEAIQMEPLPLPDLSRMQQAIYEAFPADLWES